MRSRFGESLNGLTGERAPSSRMGTPWARRAPAPWMICSGRRPEHQSTTCASVPASGCSEEAGAVELHAARVEALAHQRWRLPDDLDVRLPIRTKLPLARRPRQQPWRTTRCRMPASPDEDVAPRPVPRVGHGDMGREGRLLSHHVRLPSHERPVPSLRVRRVRLPCRLSRAATPRAEMRRAPACRSPWPARRTEPSTRARYQRHDDRNG